MAKPPFPLLQFDQGGRFFGGVEGDYVRPSMPDLNNSTYAIFQGQGAKQIRLGYSPAIKLTLAMTMVRGQ